jgi:hypothetical protein
MSPVTLWVSQLGGSMDMLSFVLLVGGLSLCLVVLLVIRAARVRWSESDRLSPLPTDTEIP